MDLQNISGEAIALTKIGITIADGNTATGIDDKWLQDEDIAALVTDGKLVASNYDTAAGSAVVQPEIAAALAASHTHANQTELDLLTDGDHDVSDGSSHANVVTNSAHVAGDGSDHANVALNDTHRALVAGNPHAVTGLEVPYVPSNPANWIAPPPADLLTAVQRLEVQVQILTAAPIP